MSITDDFKSRFYNADALSIRRPEAFNDLLFHARHLEEVIKNAAICPCCGSDGDCFDGCEAIELRGE